MVLSIALVIVGIMFAVMGYLLFFKNRTDLINNYEYDLKAGMIDEGFARRLGITELISGAVFLSAGIFSAVVGDPYRLYSFIGCFVFLILARTINQSIGDKKLKK